MARLAAVLLSGDAGRAMVVLDAGALLALAQNEQGWNAVGLIQPRLLPR